MKTILCFGNEYVEEDNLAFEIGRELKKEGFHIMKCNSPFELENYTIDEVCILDVVEGIKNIKCFNDIDIIKKENSVTLHDLDLSFYLKLMKELGRIKKVSIIGIPKNYSKEKALKEVKEKLQFVKA